MGSEFSPGAATGGQDRNNDDRLTLSDAGRREGTEHKTRNYMPRRFLAAAIAALSIVGIGASAKSAHDSLSVSDEEVVAEQPIVIEEPGFATGDKKVVSNHAYLVTGKNVRSSPMVADSEGEHNLLEGIDLEGKIIVRPRIVNDLENPSNGQWLEFVDDGKVMYISLQNVEVIPTESDNTQDSLEVIVVRTTNGRMYASNGTNQEIIVASVFKVG